MTSQMIHPTQHERLEWAYMAQDAYRMGRNFYGHRYSVASACGDTLQLAAYDTLQMHYRTWLLTGWETF